MKSAATILGHVQKYMNKKNEDMAMHNQTEIPLTTLRNGRNRDVVASTKRGRDTIQEPALKEEDQKMRKTRKMKSKKKMVTQLKKKWLMKKQMKKRRKNRVKRTKNMKKLKTQWLMKKQMMKLRKRKKRVK